jgi:hypothetical protein
MNQKPLTASSVLEHIIFLGEEYKKDLEKISDTERMIAYIEFNNNLPNKLANLVQLKEQKATLHLERIKDFLDGVQHE